MGGWGEGMEGWKNGGREGWRELTDGWIRGGEMDGRMKDRRKEGKREEEEMDGDVEK